MAPETAVRTDRVVVNPPAFDDDPGFFQRVEQLPVEKLIAHPTMRVNDRALRGHERPTGYPPLPLL